MKKTILIINLSLICLFGHFTISAQDIPIIEFDDLQEMIERPSDQTVIYNFWATWCAPCVKELPELEGIQKTGKEHNRKVVLVSLDFVSHYEKKLLPFVKEHQLMSEVLLLDAPNYNDWIPKISEKWSGAIPATLIVNNEKNVEIFMEKKFEEEELEALLVENGL